MELCFRSPQNPSRILTLNDALTEDSIGTATAISNAFRDLTLVVSPGPASEVIKALYMQETVFRPILEKFDINWFPTRKEMKIIQAARDFRYHNEDVIESDFFQYGGMTGVVILILAYQATETIVRLEEQWSTISITQWIVESIVRLATIYIGEWIVKFEREFRYPVAEKNSKLRYLHSKRKKLASDVSTKPKRHSTTVAVAKKLTPKNIEVPVVPPAIAYRSSLAHSIADQQEFQSFPTASNDNKRLRYEANVSSFSDGRNSDLPVLASSNPNTQNLYDAQGLQLQVLPEQRGFGTIQNHLNLPRLSELDVIPAAGAGPQQASDSSREWVSPYEPVPANSRPNVEILAPQSGIISPERSSFGNINSLLNSSSHAPQSAIVSLERSSFSNINSLLNSTEGCSSRNEKGPTDDFQKQQPNFLQGT